MIRDGDSKNLGTHILPTSGAMMGVCMTVISIVKFSQQQRGISSWTDELLVIDSLLFLVSAVFSYMSLRPHRRSVNHERIADRVFMTALCLMCLASFFISFEVI